MSGKKGYDPQNTPLGPGVYLFRNQAGDVIYVGKAKILRRRLASYFQPSRNRLHDPKLRALIHSIADVEIRPTRSESEALLLEDRLIKEYKPRYNVDQTDDKRFLLVALNPRETFPRLLLVRVKRNDGRLYWGPFPHAAALRETVKRVSALFQLRTCGGDCFAGRQGRSCIEEEIGNCCAPCTGKIPPQVYAERVERVRRLFDGDPGDAVDHFTARMRDAAERGGYEEAAVLRDVVQNLQNLKRRPGSGDRPRSSAPANGVPLAELAACIRLAHPPRTIECFDVSNIAGCFAVGSMVCFQDGRPAPNRYRRFRIRSVDGIDDFAMVGELVRRRYGRLLAEGRTLPDLIMVDGGPGQLSAALRALRDIGVPEAKVIALAKRQEEIYTPDAAQPLRLPRHKAALRLLQAVRDEAHRFALSYHRALRRRRLTESVLDEVPGISRTRRVALLRAFGSLRQLRDATPQAIAAAVPGIGEAKAAELLRFLSVENVGSSGCQ